MVLSDISVLTVDTLPKGILQSVYKEASYTSHLSTYTFSSTLSGTTNLPPGTDYS